MLRVEISNFLLPKVCEGYCFCYENIKISIYDHSLIPRLKASIFYSIEEKSCFTTFIYFFRSEVFYVKSGDVKLSASEKLQGSSFLLREYQKFNSMIKVLGRL